LIHRDIKPANIWLEHGSHGPARKKTEKSDDIPFRVDPCSSVAAFRVKILDFGLARAAGEQAHLTQTGVVVGTPAYMAPEQARGEAVDHRTDLFSLGCVLYRICTGRMPFQRDNTMALLPSLAADQPPPPRECNPKVPAALSDLVMRLLAEKAADRPESARAVAVALAAIDVGQRGVKPRPSREAEQPGADTCSLPAAAPKRRRPVLIGIAIALLLSGLVAALLYMLFPRHSSVVDVNFITEPYEATILLDGKPVVAPDGTAYRTPCTVSGLPAGVHHISFQLDGFDELDAGDVDLREVREIIARWTRPH
jgi:serine/threonine protein kinase